MLPSLLIISNFGLVVVIDLGSHELRIFVLVSRIQFLIWAWHPQDCSFNVIKYVMHRKCSIKTALHAYAQPHNLVVTYFGLILEPGNIGFNNTIVCIAVLD